MQAALAVARFVHFAAVAGLFGFSLFNLYAPPAAGPRSGARGVLGATAILSLASGLAWLGLVTINLGGALDAESLRTVAFEFPFGQVWTVRMVLAVIVVALSLIAAPRALVAVAGLLLASIALTGHTQIDEGPRRWLHEAVDALHLLGSGAWLGGLAGLLMILRRPDGPLAVQVGAFSKMGYAAVAAIAGSGLINAWLMVGGVAGLTGSGYGRLLMAKIALFVGMLMLALVNRFAISPSLAGEMAEDAAQILKRSVRLELILGLAVLAAAAWLGLSEPPLT